MSRATRREWIGLAVLALPCVVYAMDLTVLNLAVPSLSADLHPSSTQLLWIVDIYGFTLAASLITMGNLGDRIGRRRLLLVGAVVFGIVSTVAAYATSAAMLIAARALLGVAGATIAPSTLSLIRTMFADAHQRTFAIGVWITSFSAGGAAGPLLGGVLLEQFWWGSVFLLAVPVMGLLVAVGPRLLPEFRDRDAGRLDPYSVALSLVAVLTVVYGLKQIAQQGPGWVPVAALLAGLAVGTMFVRRQRRTAEPLLDLRLFRLPAFSAALASYTLGIFVVFGLDLFIDQYLQLVLGLSPLRAGLWLLPAALGFVVGSLLAPRLVRHLRPVHVITAGMVLAAAGFAVLTLVGSRSGLALLVSGSTVFSIGLAPVFTLAADVVVGAAPPERAGAASAISETGAELGGALGIAVLGSIGTAVYRSQVPDSVPTAGRDTLGAAVQAAARMPERIGAPLLDAARVAFTHGLQVMAGVCVVVVVAGAVLTAMLLRRSGLDRSQPDVVDAGVQPEFAAQG
ncbi:MAG TPA: MFS transporter [Jatrophihabitantaceae bacterium]|jgi:DHA2 family multidrug resistance protein-like MFS transporter